jgi:hypothetical protein
MAIAHTSGLPEYPSISSDLLSPDEGEANALIPWWKCNLDLY